jgi:hypothetical protein
MPCDLRSLLIVSWFSFIVTYLLRLVFRNDFRRPVHEMNDDEQLGDHTYIFLACETSTVSALAEREC